MSTSYNRQPLLFFSLLFLFLPSIGLGLEPVQGFHDLKFGMTEKEVKALPACSNSLECLYEIAGKNRYIVPLYQSKSTPTGSANASAQENHLPTLTSINIDMGWYSEELYSQLHRILSKNYQLTHDLTAQNERQFQTRETDELITGFQNAQVLLKIIRRKFGNLIIAMVYQDMDHATETRKLWAVNQ